LRADLKKPISIVVNNVVGVGDAEQVFQQISGTVENFLKQKVKFLGMIPSDSQVPEAIRQQIPVVQYAPTSPASRAVRLIAHQLHNRTQKGFMFETQSFWNKLANG
jgi:flagellar biosynthesis protein FlhG